MSNTPRKAFPYPAASDPPDGSGGIYNLAKALDDLYVATTSLPFQVTNTNGTASTSSLKYRVQDGICHGWGYLQLNVPSPISGTSGIAITLPYQPVGIATRGILNGGVVYQQSSGPLYSGHILWISGTSAALTVSGAGAEQNVSATVPFAWAPGDTIHVAFSFPIN